MNKSQPEAVAEAMLEPDRKAQDEVRRKRLAETESLAKRRKVAWFLLIGGLLGAGVALLTGHCLSEGIIWGGVAGAVVGWPVTFGRHNAAP